MKPDDVRVMQLLKVFELLLAEVDGGEVRFAYLFILHLFDRILLLGLYMLVQKHFISEAMTGLIGQIGTALF